jgi:hypothetical protein
MDIKKVCPKMKFQKTFAKKSAIFACDDDALILIFYKKNRDCKFFCGFLVSTFSVQKYIGKT